MKISARCIASDYPSYVVEEISVGHDLHYFGALR